MSRLDSKLLSLDKGLNLQTAKLLAPEGSVSDTLNYEQVDFQGQKRIDGFSRYDGSLLATIDDAFCIEEVPDGYTVVYYSDRTLLLYDTTVVGVYVEGIGPYSIYATVNSKLVPKTAIPASKFFSDDTKAYYLTTDELYLALLWWQNNLRSIVEELPGDVAGLHWFRDRLYAVADITTYSISSEVPINVNTSTVSKFCEGADYSQYVLLEGAVGDVTVLSYSISPTDPEAYVYAADNRLYIAWPYSYSDATTTAVNVTATVQDTTGRTADVNCTINKGSVTYNATTAIMVSESDLVIGKPAFLTDGRVVLRRRKTENYFTIYTDETFSTIDTTVPFTNLGFATNTSLYHGGSPFIVGRAPNDNIYVEDEDGNIYLVDLSTGSSTLLPSTGSTVYSTLNTVLWFHNNTVPIILADSGKYNIYSPLISSIIGSMNTLYGIVGAVKLDDSSALLAFSYGLGYNTVLLKLTVNADGTATLEQSPAPMDENVIWTGGGLTMDKIAGTATFTGFNIDHAMYAKYNISDLTLIETGEYPEDISPVSIINYEIYNGQFLSTTNDDVYIISDTSAIRQQYSVGIGSYGIMQSDYSGYYYHCTKDTIQRIDISVSCV